MNVLLILLYYIIFQNITSHVFNRIIIPYTLSHSTVGTAIQATYTSVFGVIAALLFMRTGNILAPIASHIIVSYLFCFIALLFSVIC